MYNYDTIIKQLEAMTPAHQDQYYTNSPEMFESLEARGHHGSSI